MKVNKEILKKAASLFKSVNTDVLFVNKKGHFFTSKNLAENSVKSAKDIAEIRKADVAKYQEELEKEAAKKKAEEEAKRKAAEEAAKKKAEEEAAKNQGNNK